MKAQTAGFLLIASIAAAAPGLAKPPTDNPSANPAEKLRAALQTMAQSKSAEMAARTNTSQGAAHASPRAIEVVCSHDNPSAEHAAICRPVSPD
jgi:hypothetical protein